MAVRTCPHCATEKPLDAFGRIGGSYQSWCKACRSAATSVRYRALPEKEAWARWTAGRLVGRARVLKIDFNLNWRFLASIAPAVCPALGIPLIYTRGVQGIVGHFSPSVDKVDPSGGYTRDNVVVVSQLANMIKSNATAEQIVAVGAFYLNLERSSHALVEHDPAPVSDGQEDRDIRYGDERTA